MVVVAYCNKILGGVEGVSMSMCEDCWLLRVLGLLHLLEGAAATQHSGCSTSFIIAARFLSAESAACCTTIWFPNIVLV